MATPQIKNGFTRIANEILEALAKVNLSAYETRTLLALLRKTYGFQKKEDRISVSQFQKITGLKRQHQSRALKELEERQIITRIGDGFINNYLFQKDFSKWRTITKRGDGLQTVTRIGDTLSPESATILSPELVTTKEKRKYTKESGVSLPSRIKKDLDVFLKNKAEEIYQLYPKKEDRPNSLKSIIRILKDPPLELFCGAGGLLLAIKNYRAKILAKGTDPEYQIQSNNFFGKAARWKGYLTTTSGTDQESPFASNFS
jgi:phage replication O-like protein O